MKGFQVTLEQLGAIVLLIIVVAFAVYFLFKEKIVDAPPPTIEELAKCTKHLDCTGDERGKLCMSLNSGAYDCGCITNEDCPVPPAGKKTRCSENICEVYS